MLSTSEINKKSHVNAFHAFKCRSVARREYFGTEICFHLLPSTDLSLIPKSMPDKIVIILGFFKVFRYSSWETIHVFQSP